MTLAEARLTLRLSRFELIAFGGVIVVLAIATVIAAAWVDSLRPAAECFATFSGTGVGGPVFSSGSTTACDAALNAWYSASGGTGVGVGLLIFLSFAAAVFLGVPIVAREVERGTSRLAWSLTPSRMRWFLARMLPLLVVLAVVTFLAGVAIDRFTAASTQDPDLSKSFLVFGFRGLLIASRALFIFGVAVLVGAIFARALPAVIITAVVATIGLAGGERVHSMILEREAVAIPVSQDGSGPATVGAMFFDQKFVLPDGSLVGYEYFGNGSPYDDNGNPKYPMVAIVVPGERYRFVETREAVVLAGGSLVALVARRLRGLAAAGGLTPGLTDQNWIGGVGASTGPADGVRVVGGPRRGRIVTAPNRKTHPPTTNSPSTPLIEATSAPAAGPMTPAA